MFKNAKMYTYIHGYTEETGQEVWLGPFPTEQQKMEATLHLTGIQEYKHPSSDSSKAQRHFRVKLAKQKGSVGASLNRKLRNKGFDRLRERYGSGI